MEEMQFAAIVMMVMMCSALIVLMPNRVKRDKVINRSRLLMIGSLALIGAQFLVQYITQLRTMGITQAVLVTTHTFRTIDVDRCHAGGDSLLGYISSC